MFDCHAHFHCGTPEFQASDIDDLYNNKHEACIDGVVLVAENVKDCHQITKQAEKYPHFYYACVGVHPVQEGGSLEQAYQEFIAWFDQMDGVLLPRIIGIGECGLDYSPHVLAAGKTEKDKNDIKQLQKTIFQYQIELAMKHNLPVNVHSRQAGHYAIQTLKECQATKCLLHAFDGKSQYAIEASHKYGYYFSVPPSIGRSPSMQKWAKSIDIGRVVLESDSPALGPVPGQTNNPRNCRVSRQWLLDNRKNISEMELDNTLNLNVKKLFFPNVQ